jgi:hypothetical protein
VSITRPSGAPIVTCRTCIFWEKRAVDKGDCHRYPPYVGSVNALYRGVQVVTQGSVIPETSPLGWCGEHPEFKQWLKVLEQ